MFTNIVVCDDLGIVVFKIFQQPVVVGVDVWKGDDLAAFENG